MKSKNLNYCRDYIEYTRKFTKLYAQTSNEEIKDYIKELSAGKAMIGVCEKFLLPVNGIFMNGSDYSALDKDMDIRLPYKKMVLEYNSSGEVEDGDFYAPKRIVVLTESDDGILLMPVFYNAEVKMWMSIEPIGIMANDSFICDGDKVTGVRFRRIKGYNKNIPTSDYDDEVRVFASFINALSCSNVTIRKSDKKKAFKKRALPFDDYKTLMINSVGSVCGENQRQGREKREHLRRGHIRRYSSGVSIWINSSVINSGKGFGRIHKAYKLN